MGIHHEDGYSADVEGFFVVDQVRIRLAKTNGCTFVLAEHCVFPPRTEGDLLVIVDGKSSSRRVEVIDGILPGQTIVRYQTAVPF
jgi:hypothetical protein